MKELLGIICALLDRGEDFVLARITNRKGSAPRTAGAQMIVTADGHTYGTIGGGLLEAVTIEKCAFVIQECQCRFLYFDLTNENIGDMDMICGGNVEILLDFIKATSENRLFFSAWRDIANDRKQGFFITTIQESKGEINKIDHCLIAFGELLQGHFPLSDRAYAQVKLAGSKHTSMIVTVTVENATVLIEPILKPKTVFIFGAGHVAKPTAVMVAMVGFRLAICDDREQFANTERFPAADEVHVIADFDSALSGLPIDEDSYIVILTRGHLYDKCVLAQALKTNAEYIGMIGSRHKRNAIFKSLEEEGFSKQDLERVFSPIGLSIGAETPEEIALSIVAELVRKRATKAYK